MFSVDRFFVDLKYLSAVAMVGLFLMPPQSRAQSADSTSHQADHASAGQALSLLFDSRRAPAAKSMGLLQGNFLDAVDVSGSLQLAVVIDASESMGDQIDSIKQNLNFLVGDLDQILDGSVETAIVTYADVGEKTIPVTVHSQGFVDAQTTERIVKQISTVTGKPYFPEAIDLGVQRAIGELPWSNSPDVERWVLVIGDAPPYEASFDETETGAKRWYATDLLVDLANQKGIKVHCLLCTSREEEKKSFESMLVDTQNFMRTLSSDTGGLMLDMSFDQVRNSLAKNAQRIRVKTVQIGHITHSDIEEARGPAPEQANLADQALRVVVVPFLPLDEMTFFHERPEVQVATELRNLIRQMPNTRVSQPRQIEEQISQLKREGIPVKDWPQALCFRLRADVIVTGELSNAKGQLAADVQLRGKKSKDVLASAKLTADVEQLARQIIGQFSQTRNPSMEIQAFVDRLRQHATEQKIGGTETGALSRLEANDRKLLLSGLSALEQATGYALGDLNAFSLLNAAEESLKRFVENQPQHPYGLMMLASTQFNLASALEASGAVDEAKTKFTESKQAIQSAFQFRNQLVDELLRLELEGDYHLMVRREFETSIERYNTIVKQSELSPLNTGLHAHWLLAGIRSGDWGIDQDSPNLVDLTEARKHLIQILAHWPESAQADLIRQNLMWDPNGDKSRNPYLPHFAAAFASN